MFKKTMLFLGALCLIGVPVSFFGMGAWSVTHPTWGFVSATCNEGSTDVRSFSVRELTPEQEDTLAWNETQKLCIAQGGPLHVNKRTHS